MYVYSTLTNDVNYSLYADGGGDVPIRKGSVLVRGGSGVANKKTLITPMGAVPTPITDEEYEMLKCNPVFQKHEANGFVTVEKRAIDGEKMGSVMSGRDSSAPLVDADFKEGQAPSTGAPNKK